MDAKEFWKRLKEEGCLSPGLLDEFIQIYGDRGQKALQALEKRMVRRYLDFVVVVGASHEYVVEEDFCTCQDFMYRGKCCWHLLAARLASVCGGYETCDRWYQDSWTGDR
ncbi:MAG: SWIM zinc finger family protein [Methanolinea sp.]|jgi:predicted nucleic acid-binding Zn finger protein|nr:SWIM zinc finger family protein [Methanolinea sp.]